MFAPEFWGEVDYFNAFCETAYTFDDTTQRALVGVSGHFGKCRRLLTIAEQLRPNLQVDQAELDHHGYTPAEHARDLATVIEAAIVELYSAVNCTVQVLRAVYGRSTRGFKNLTRSFFENVRKLAGSFPDDVKTVVDQSVWYKPLRSLRDELTHRAPGFLHLSPRLCGRI